MRKPYYQDGSVTLYHGDCREILPELQEAIVDLLLTDPPYGIDYVTSWRSRSDALRKPIANDSDLSALESILMDLQRLLKCDRHWYVFASPRMLAEARAVCDKLGTGTKQVLAWDKGDRGTVGDLACGFGEAWEAILYGMTGRRELNGKRPRTVLRCDWSSRDDPVHPTVKPIDLLGRLISMSTHPNELVLDPFCGSGTTLRAAKDLSRRAIGIELEEKYCEVTANRLSQATLDFGGTA